jgi:hypothetical protein
MKPLPHGYATLNHALLSSMRREWNNAMRPFRLGGHEWRAFRVRVGLRALAAVVSHGVDYNKAFSGTLQREGIWIDGQPYDAMRRPYFKASPVMLDRSLHPLDFVVERVV